MTDTKMPETAAIVDLETTGLDPGKHVVIEAAVVTYDLVHMTVLSSYSTLVYQADAVRHGNPAQKINGIDPAWLRTAPTPEQVWPAVANILRGTDVAVAHRAAFDAKFFPRSVRESRPWACTKYGVHWPAGTYGDHLVDLVRDHRLRLRPLEEAYAVRGQHRALGDCLLLVELLESAHQLGLDVRRAIAGAIGVLEPMPPAGAP